MGLVVSLMSRHSLKESGPSRDDYNKIDYDGLGFEWRAAAAI